MDTLWYHGGMMITLNRRDATCARLNCIAITVPNNVQRVRRSGPPAIRDTGCFVMSIKGKKSFKLMKEERDRGDVVALKIPLSSVMFRVTCIITEVRHSKNDIYKCSAVPVSAVSKLND